MTVATDIASRTNCERLYVLRIEGLNYDIVQPHDRGAPAGGNWRTNVLQCLEVGSEASMGLDLKTMHVDSSALTFGLRNCYDTDLAMHANACDPNVAYLWAKLFAPGAWCNSSNAWTYLRWARNNPTAGVLEADASTIYVTHDPDDRGFAASGTAYIGAETFSYTGHAAETGGTNYSSGESSGKFTGVTKGLYPAVGSSNWGYTYLYPQDDFLEGQTDADGQLVVSTVPYTMIGRRVALYVTTWDHASGAWIDINSAELLWVGSISDQINYHAEQGVWQLSCESMLKDLDREVLRHQPPSGVVRGINLWGAKGLELEIDEFSWTGGAARVHNGTLRVSFTAGYYSTVQEVVAELNDALATATFTAVDGGSRLGIYYVNMNNANVGGEYGTYGFGGRYGDDERYQIDFRPVDGHFHPFSVLGLPSTGRLTSYEDSTGTYSLVRGLSTNSPCTAYHPCDNNCNGGRLYVTQTCDYFWFVDQGSWSSERAYWYFPDALPLGPSSDRRGHVATITGHSHLAASNYLDLDTSKPVDTVSRGGFVAGAGTDDQGLSGEGNGWRAVYFQESAPGGGARRGPFELLLYPLLSTGTDAYNESSYTYDSCPLSMSVGIQEALVNVQSFLDADQAVLAANPGLAFRTWDFVTEATPWLELFEREARLFGKALVWKSGQLTVSDLFSLPTDMYATTLSESTNAQRQEMPDASLSTGYVVNSWKVEAIHTHDRSKFRTVELNDATSRECLKMRIASKIVHHGLRSPGREAEIAQHLQQAFDAARDLLRYPWQRVDVTLAPTLQLDVAIGDIVRYQADNHPDPYGSGLMSIDALALVIDFAWDYSTNTGRASLLCYSRYDALDLTPWAPSALVDIDATNGGLDAGPPVVMTLTALAYGRSGEQEDGEAFEEDDVVYVKCTHELDPASASHIYGPCTIDNYSIANNELTFKGTPSFAGWVATDEHIVVAGDWGDVPSAQKTRGLWQASKTTMKLDTDPAQRWG